MRVIKLTWNQRLDTEQNFSVQTDVILDDDAEAERAGRDAVLVLEAFRVGMTKAADDAR